MAEITLRALPESQWTGNAAIAILPTQEHWSGDRNIYNVAGASKVIHADNLTARVGTTFSTVTSDIAAGSKVIPVADSSIFAPGDDVLWQLGEIHYDRPEPLQWGFAKVVSVSPGVVNIDRPLQETFVLADAIGSKGIKLWRLPKLRPLEAENATFNALDNGVDYGVRVRARRGVTIRGITGKRLRAGTVSAQYIDGLRIEDCGQEGCVITADSQGAAFYFMETRNAILDRARVSDCPHAVFAEARAEVAIRDLTFETNYVGPRARKVLVAGGQAKMWVNGITCFGPGGYSLAHTSNGHTGWGGRISFIGPVRLIHPNDVGEIPLDAIQGTLEMSIAGVQENYDFSRRQLWKRRIPITPGIQTIYGPPGMVAGLQGYVSAATTIGPDCLKNVYWGRKGPNAANGHNLCNDFWGKQLAPGRAVSFRALGGTVMGSVWGYRQEQVKVIVTGGEQANPDLHWIELRAWIAPLAGGEDWDCNEQEWGA